MTKTKLLIGSLSNDLFRVANLTQRGSTKGAARFLKEAKRWASELKHETLEMYINKIVNEIINAEENIDLKLAEKYLMYGVLLQNYAIHKL